MSTSQPSCDFSQSASAASSGNCLPKNSSAFSVHRPQSGKQAGIHDQVVVERMNVVHIDRLRTTSTFKASLYMGRKKTIETQVQDVLTFCTLLTGPVQRDDRLARSGCTANHGSWIGGHSPRGPDLFVRELDQTVIQTGQVSAQTECRLQVGPENLARLL